MKTINPIDAIQKIDERLVTLRADLETIKICQHAKMETIEELTRIRDELTAASEVEARVNLKEAIGVLKTEDKRAGRGVKYSIENDGS